MKRKTDKNNSTMDTLKVILTQRGVPTDHPESIETELPATTVTKMGDVLIFMINKPRVAEKDVTVAANLTRENGATTGILVVLAPPSETILYAVSQQSHILQIFHVGQLIDISQHRRVPRHRILSSEEVNAFLAKYNISTDKIVETMRKNHIQLNAEDPVLQQIALKYKEYFPMPQIWSQDAMARWVGAKPGNIIEVIRKSESAGGTPYYRFCVASV